MFAVSCSYTPLLLLVCVCFVVGGQPGIFCVCAHLCVCMLSFLVNSTEGGKAMPGLYPLWSLVSIIEEWYLQKGIGLRGAHKGGGIGRKSKIKIKNKKIEAVV